MDVAGKVRNKPGCTDDDLDAWTTSSTYSVKLLAVPCLCLEFRVGGARKATGSCQMG